MHKKLTSIGFAGLCSLTFVSCKPRQRSELAQSASISARTFEVAGQKLGSLEYEGHEYIRYGRSAKSAAMAANPAWMIDNPWWMIARPALMKEGDLAALGKYWGKESGSSISAESQRTLFWRKFSEKYGLPVDPEAADSMPYGIVRYQNPGESSHSYSLNCYACHIGEVRMPDGSIKPWLGAPNQAFNYSRLVRDLVFARGLSEFTAPGYEALMYANDQALDPLAVGQSYAGHFGWLVVSGRKPNLDETQSNRLEAVKAAIKSMLQGNAASKDARYETGAIPFAKYFVGANVRPWWWNEGTRMYSSGNLLRDDRWERWPLALMYLGDQMSGEVLRSAEFRNAMDAILALVKSTIPPPFPGPINYDNARKGAEVFASRRCRSCHDHAAIRAVGTDPKLARSYAEFGVEFAKLSWWKGLDPRDTNLYNSSGTGTASRLPGMYAAPPLVATWTRPLVLHNASLPYQWLFGEGKKDIEKLRYKTVGVFDPSIGPVGGAPLKVIEETPDNPLDPAMYIDPKRYGNSPNGHPFALYSINPGDQSIANPTELGHLAEYLKVRCRLPYDADDEGSRATPSYGMLTPDGVCQPLE